ncbi:glutathione S-transferase family protein [Variovorax sp. H27-G14]|uniref:glutathione S-transferase family protein n=1 Tax=Variovorax sp. H27-G14 TaxID=3111914 RepID=UPI0038FCF694
MRELLLYGSAGSGHSYKVRSFLLLAGIAHACEWVDLGLARTARPSAFIAASKFGEVPVLVDSGTAYCQSNAILMHLALRDNAFAGEKSEWPTVVEWLSWEANRVGFSIPNLRHSMLWARQPSEVVAYLRERAIADLSTLDGALRSTEFLLPSGPTIADLSCSAYLFWLSQAGIAEDEFPHVARWLRSLRSVQGWVHPDDALRA